MIKYTKVNEDTYNNETMKKIILFGESWVQFFDK